VQAAREAARSAQCANNLRQIGLASQNYVSRFGKYPCVYDGIVIKSAEYPGVAIYSQRFSHWTRILPDLDQNVLYDQLNFTDVLSDPSRSKPDSNAENSSAISTVLRAFLCPSDAAAAVIGTTGDTNYRVNIGWSNMLQILGDDPNGGPFNSAQGSPAAVTDGLSNTVPASEKLRGIVEGSPFDPRTSMASGFVGTTPAETYHMCATKTSRHFGYMTYAGLSRAVATQAHTMYGHIGLPNDPSADCLGRVLFWYGMASARSNPPGGVQAAFADGSVRFVKSSVNRQVWKAIGTRAGAEAVSADSF
ncbi:MAG: DUF1559 domain-containing protein, partial [Planctomycetota bacterium]|nr:DUF1559 domain-containing protein [Planctomycetota bacterium]